MGIGIPRWLEDAVDDVGGAFKAAPGVVLDVARMAPGAGNLVTQFEPAKRLQHRGAEIMGSPLGTGLSRGVMAPVGGTLDEAVTGYQWVRDNMVSHPLAAAVRAAQEGPFDPFLGPFRRKPGTIGEVWQHTNDVSPGQQVIAPFGALEANTSYREAISNPNQFADQRWFSWSSGTVDAVLSFEADPLVIGGKTFALARAGTMVRPIVDPEKAINGSRVKKWLDFVEANQGKPDVIGENWAVRRSAARDQIAWAFANAGDRDTARLLTRVAFLDKRALDRDPVTGEMIGELVDRRADLAAAITRASSNVDPQMQFTYNLATNPDHVYAAMSPLEKGALANTQKELSALEAQDRMLSIAEDHLQGAFLQSSPGAPLQNWAANRRFKWYRKEVAQRGWYSTPVTIIRSLQDRRLGAVRFHERDAGRHMEEMLKRIPRVSEEEHRSLVSQAMGIQTEGEFEATMVRADRFVFKKFGDEYNLPADTVEGLYQSYARSRQKMIDSIQSRKFTAVKDPNTGREIDVWVNPQDPTEMFHAPLLESDLRNTHILVDPDEVGRVLRQHNGLLAHIGFDRANGRWREGADWLNSVWKASVLMRGGYTLRVLGDDQARMFAKFMGLVQLEALGKGSEHVLRNNGKRIGELIRRIRTEGETWYQKGTPLLDRDSMNALRIGDEERLKIRGVMAPGAFADAPEYRSAISSFEGWNEFVRRPEGGYLTQMRKEAGRWVSVAYDEAGTATEKAYHAEVWKKAINDRLGNSLVARKLMAGESHDDVVRWLRSNDANARQLRKRLPMWTHNPEEYVGKIGMYLDSYVPRELREKALRHEVTTSDLAAVVDKPIVHGEQLSYELGDHPVNSILDRGIAKAMKWLGSLPSDVLSRQVTFDAAYKGYMRDAIKNLEAQGVDLTGKVGFARLTDIAKTARRQALKDLRGLLFDLGSKSQWAQAVHLIAPFAGAWQDTLAVWLRLGIENPHNIARLLMTFDLPARAGILSDKDGRPVESQGVRIPGNDWISFPLPKGMQHLAGMNRVGFNVKSLNLVMQGDPWWLPGTGPMVAFPVNELLVHTRPEYADYVPFILPFGAQYGKNVMDRAAAVTFPATFKRVLAASETGTDASDAGTVINIMRGEYARYLNGERDDIPKWEEIYSKAKTFKMIQVLAQFIQPGQTQFTTPAKLYVDEYRRLRETYGEDEAQKRFLQKYGDDSWVFFTAISKNNTGIQATIESVRKSRELQKYIRQYPGFGGLLIGPEGNGAFSSAAYNFQLNNAPGPGMDPFRERISPQESLKRGMIDAGWREYQKYMVVLDNQLFARGLRTYYQQGAEDLLNAKQIVTKYLANKFRTEGGEQVWYEDFAASDPTRQPQKIEALRKIAQIPDLKNNPLRTDIKWLNYYFMVRDQFVAQLQNRAQYGGAKTLNAQSNFDLFQAWQAVKMNMASQDTMFADLYHRYLERDNLEWDPNISTLPDQEVKP